MSVKFFIIAKTSYHTFYFHPETKFWDVNPFPDAALNADQLENALVEARELWKGPTTKVEDVEVLEFTT